MASIQFIWSAFVWCSSRITVCKTPCREIFRSLTISYLLCAVQKLLSHSSLPIDWQVMIVIVNTGGKSSSRLRNTVDSKVGVMSRYSMSMMLIVGKLIRWRLSSWFDFFFRSLSHVRVYLRWIFVVFRARLWSIFICFFLIQVFCHWTVRIFARFLFILLSKLTYIHFKKNMSSIQRYHS